MTKKIIISKRRTNKKHPPNPTVMIVLLSAVCLTLTLLFVIEATRLRAANERQEEEKEMKQRVIISVVDIPLNPTPHFEKISNSSRLPVFVLKNAAILKDIKSNPYKLSLEKIIDQFESARIPSLKDRVKRFACWHSCFGEFRRRTLRQPFSRSTLVKANVTIIRAPPPKPITEEQEQPKPPAAPPKTNELGEGETPPAVKRPKKSPSSTDYFNRKTKVVLEKEVTVEEEPRKEIVKGESTKASSSSYRQASYPKESEKKGNGESTKSSPKNVATIEESTETPEKNKVPASAPASKTESSEADDKEAGANDENMEESGSSEEAEGEDDASSSEEEGEKDGGDGVDKDDLADEGGQKKK